MSGTPVRTRGGLALRGRLAGAALLVAGAWGACGARAEAQAPSTAPTPSAAREEIPPAMLLGGRVVRAEHKVKVIPVLVLVKDAESYLRAVSAWTTTSRFPVFIDDGSLAAAEEIARFARAFKPSSVVRFAAALPKDAKPDSPEFRSVARERIRAALNASWGQPEGFSTRELIGAMQKMEHIPPGVVVMNANDPAWVGGLALAAAHGQPIVFLDALQAVDHFFSVQEADDLCARIEAEVEATGLGWRALGDDVDAVTLAMNTPAKLDKGGHEFLAMTDRVGRLGTGVEVPQRWAWAGQVHGSARESASRAMCAIFLTQGSAWLFDGYPDSAPWNAYDCTKAGEMMRSELSFRVEVIDTPKQSAHEWRLRAVRPVDVEMVFINTKGNADFFELETGQCRPADVPVLQQPCAVHIVHSWSALFPGNRDLLAGRWMERGAYFYVGSVHEPYLSAFLPTPAVAARMLSGAAWGGAVRLDSGPVWKIAVFGDPLIVYTRVRIRSEEKLPLAADDALSGVREDMLGGNFVDAFRALLLAGRDEDVAKLAEATLREKKESLTPEAAALTILPLFRAGKLDAMLGMYALLDRERAATPMLRDALWLAAYPQMLSLPEKWMNILRVQVRGENIARDVGALASVEARRHGKDAGLALIRQVQGVTSDKAQQEALDKLAQADVSVWGK